MNLLLRSSYRSCLLIAIAAAVLGFGCAKKVTPPPPPKQEAPPPARPTVTLQANPTSINKGESSTLTWNSTDATQLSIDRRAAAVKQYLVSLGVSADRMNTVSFGKEKPFCVDHNESCWQQNRRGHFVMAN